MRDPDAMTRRVGTSSMSDLTVVARHGQWMLVDDEDAELGAFASPAEALAAIGDYAQADDAPRYVLILEPGGDWEEQFIRPPTLH